MKSILTYLLLGIILYCTQIGFCANENKLDSLLSVYDKTRNDTIKVNAAGQIFNIYIHNNTKLAYKYAEKMLQISERINWEGGLADAWHCLGHYYLIQSELDKTRVYWEKVLAIREKGNDDEAMARVVGNLGILYTNTGDYAKALDFYFRALELAEKTKNSLRISIQLANIGILYAEIRNYEKALNYYHRAIEINKLQQNKEHLLTWFSNIGVVYNYLKRNEEALRYYELALAMAIEKNDKERLSLIYANMGNVYSDQKKYDIALEYNFKSIEIANEMGFTKDILSCYLNIIKIYNNTKKYEKAEIYLNKAEVLLIQVPSKSIEKTFYKLQSEHFSALGKYKEAFRAFVMYDMLSDSLLTSESYKKQVQLEMQYDFDKKAYADSLTFAKNNELREAEIQQQEALLKENRVIQMVLFGGFALLLVFVFILYRRFREINLQKKLIEEQTSIIEQRQKEIIDSIRYAKRIQDCLLPKERLISQKLRWLKLKIQKEYNFSKYGHGE